MKTNGKKPAKPRPSYIAKDLWPLCIRTRRLKPDPINSRGHSPEQRAVIKASLLEFGQRLPVVVRKDNLQIEGGNERLDIFRELGWTWIAAVRCDDDEIKAMRYALVENRSAEMGEWKDEQLAASLRVLQASNDEAASDLFSIGFDDARVDEVFAIVDPPGDIIEDEIPEVPEPVTKPGDLWILGEHRVLCGDCTKREAVARLMGDECAPLLNTDPPYGVDYAAVKNGIPRSGFKDIQARGGDIKNDDLTDGATLQAFLESAIRAALPHLTENPAFYLWHPMLTQGTFFAAAAAAAADILIHRQIIWVKPGFVLTRSGMYHWKHELCFYGWIKGKPCPWYGDKSQVSVWEVGRERETEHPTQKPLELFARPMLNHTRKGEVVYEPFAGSGSQLIAAEQLNRRCYGLEIEPRYCDVIVARWEALTGKKARLEGRSRRKRPRAKAAK